MAGMEATLLATVPTLKQQIGTQAFAPLRIRRGGNHNGMPWRAVDGISDLSSENGILLRGLFVWGQGYSLHLLLAGRWLSLWPDVDAEHELAAANWLIYKGHNPWNWLAADETPTTSTGKMHWNKASLIWDAGSVSSPHLSTLMPESWQLLQQYLIF